MKFTEYLKVCCSSSVIAYVLQFFLLHIFSDITLVVCQKGINQFFLPLFFPSSLFSSFLPSFYPFSILFFHPPLWLSNHKKFKKEKKKDFLSLCQLRQNHTNNKSKLHNICDYADSGLFKPMTVLQKETRVILNILTITWYRESFFLVMFSYCSKFLISLYDCISPLCMITL